MSSTAGQQVIRFRVVSPQPVVARGIACLLEGTQQGLTMMSARNGDAPDVVLYDVTGLHEGDGADLDVLLAQPSPVIAVTQAVRPDLGAAALARGAQAAISMGASGEDFRTVVDAARSGTLRRCGLAQPVDPRRAAAEFGLTRREAEVVALIVRGRSNRQIAQGTRLSPNSVKSYIRSAYRKMGVLTRTQAVAWGIQHGFDLSCDRRSAG